MECEALNRSFRWVELALGDVDALPAEVVAHSENCAKCAARLLQTRRTLAQISHLPAGRAIDLAHFLPPADGDYEPLPPELEATLTDIPKGQVLEAVSALKKRPQAQNGEADRQKSSFMRAKWRHMAVAFLAAAGLLLMVRAPKDVIKGPSEVQSMAQAAPVALYLVRQLADGEVERLRLQGNEAGEWRLRAKAGEALLPVIQSPQHNLSKNAKFVQILWRDGEKEELLYASQVPLSLKRLPQTAHMYVLPESIELERSGRLHILLADQPLRFPTGEGPGDGVLEGTALMEVW